MKAKEMSAAINGAAADIARRERDRKRFELVKAWGPTFYDEDLRVIDVGMVIAAADDALTALYGPEPGKDES